MGAPQALKAEPGGECAARTIHRVSAVEGIGVAAIRSNSAVTPEACAARVSLRLATRSSCRASPKTSSTTAPSASQASASAALRNALSTSAARTVTSKRGSRPSSESPLIDSAPDSISEKSCRTQTSGRRRVIRPAKPRDEAGGHSTLTSLGEHFMHRGDRKAAAQHRIRAGMAERYPVEPMRIAMRLDALDAASQSRKRVCACADHAPVP